MDDEPSSSAPVNRRPQRAGSASEPPSASVAVAGSSKDSEGSAATPRSLRDVTQSFIALLREEGAMELNDAAARLGVPKRRLYDITNVMDGIGMINKIGRNRVALLCVDLSMGGGAHRATLAVWRAVALRTEQSTVLSASLPAIPAPSHCCTLYRLTPPQLGRCPRGRHGAGRAVRRRRAGPRAMRERQRGSRPGGAARRGH